MRFDQDLCLSLGYDFKKLLWQDELNPRVRCAFGNVLNFDREIGCAERKMENRARGGRPPRWGGNRAGRGGGEGGGRARKG